MKKVIFTLLFAAFSAASLLATHIVGGSIFYKNLGGDEYEITLVVYRDCYNGVPAFDDPASVGIFDQDFSNYYGQLLMSPISDDTLNFQNTPICFQQPSVSCVHRAIYVGTITLPQILGGYKLAYQRCCRTGQIQNVVNALDAGSTITCTVPSGSPNSSPVLKNGLPYYGFFNKPFIYDASATDVDGDSLAYRLVAPQNGASPDVPQPQPPAVGTIFDLPFSSLFSLQNVLGSSQYPLKIDEKTGEMSALPNLQGMFVVAFAIDEFRGGQFLATHYHEIAVTVFAGSGGLGVSGLLTVEGAGQLDDGEAQLIQRNPFTDSLWIEKAVAGDATYSFSDVYTSKYLVRAVPTPNSIYFGTHFPTYYPNHYFWYNATEVEVCAFSAQNIDIQLRADSLLLFGGTGLFSGKVVAPDGSPMADFELWLMEAQTRTPARWAVTDANGFFAFDELPFETYLLYANQRNTLIFNDLAPVLTLTAAQPTLENFVFRADETMLVFETISTDEPTKNQPLALFPNPAESEIRFDLAGEKALAGQIFDAAGRAVLTFKNSSRADVSGLPEGLFQVEILTEKGRRVGRFVKN